MSRVISDNLAIQYHYDLCISNGCSEKLAEALAFRQGPILHTEATFNEGDNGDFNGFSKFPEIGEFYARELRARGGSPVGKRYLHTLARYPGDPEAWVSGDGDMKRVLDKHPDWNSTGFIEQEGRPPEEAPKRGVAGGVADDILEAEVQGEIAKNPEAATTPQKRADLKESIRQKRKPRYVA